MELLECMEARHSVRQYTDKAIEAEKREILDNLVKEINEESGLHIQILYEEPKCFDSFMAHYGKFSGVRNYIALVGKKSPNLEENMGYYGEKLVLKAQELGLNTCWVALTKGKSAAVVNKGEKQGCLIPMGYGRNQGVSHKSKAMSEVSNYGEGQPGWFKQGMEAVLLAPTAMNQQKFFFTFHEDETVTAVPGSGFYTKEDLGIARYHFEAVTGKKVVK